MNRTRLITTVALTVGIAAAASYSQERCRGRVRVENNTVVSDQGTLLRGYDFFIWRTRHETEVTQSREAYQQLKGWSMNCVRLAVVFDHRYVPGGGHYSIDETLPIIDNAVRLAREEGVYIIVEYHDCARYVWSHITEFWNKVAPRYKDEPHVIYEIANEPVPWNISDYDDDNLRDQEELYALIRGHAPETHIILISVATAYGDMVGAARKLNGIDWTNASFGFHCYDTRNSNDIRALHAEFPCIATEALNPLPGRPPAEMYPEGIDGEKSTAKVLEEIGISWIDWVNGIDPGEEYQIEILLEDARDRGYMWEADDYDRNGCGPIEPVEPSIAADPADVSIEEGGSARFTVEAEGYPLSYQWYRDGEALEGETAASLTLENVPSDADGSRLHVTVSNELGTATSSEALLTVTPFAGLSIPKVTGSPEWAHYTDQAVDNAIIGDAAPGPQDLSASFRMAWSAEALLVHVLVTDEQVVSSSETDYSNDNVEVYVDADNSRPSSYGARQFQFRVVAGSEDVFEKEGRSDGVAARYASSDDGYTVTLTIPWTTLGVTASAGAFIGLEVQVADNDGSGRESKLAWSATEDNAWEDPSVFGKARLSDQPTASAPPRRASGTSASRIRFRRSARTLLLPDGAVEVALYAIDGRCAMRAAVPAAQILAIPENIRSGRYVVHMTGRRGTVRQPILIP
jgi:hypothetical protein